MLAALLRLVRNALLGAAVITGLFGLWHLRAGHPGPTGLYFVICLVCVLLLCMRTANEHT